MAEHGMLHDCKACPRRPGLKWLDVSASRAASSGSGTLVSRQICWHGAAVPQSGMGKAFQAFRSKGCFISVSLKPWQETSTR